MKEILTIIIPVYNCKKYLKVCLDSIVSQCQMCAKVLLIDDGSTDGSELICDNYARDYSSIQVVHLKNCGVSHARNVGLDMVTTEWVMFADADDAFFDGTIKRVKELVNTYGSTVFLGNDRGIDFYNKCIPNEKDTLGLYSVNIAFGLATNPAANTELAKQFSSILFGACWGKVLKYNIIRNQHIRFNEKLTISEDAIFIIEYLKNLGQDDKIILTNEKVYFYRQNFESVTFKMKAFEYMEKRYQVTQEILRLSNDISDSKMRDDLEMFALNNFLLALGSAASGDRTKTYSKFRTYLLNNNICKMIENGKGRALSTSKKANFYYRGIVFLWNKKLFRLGIWYYDFIFKLKRNKNKLMKLHRKEVKM